ncbi:hypothetical protein M378DRAFT_13277 [Amanita muscaria Koide BX008]|uniref:Uncharacterized protein n=1 Tax=Amanita muscaria (strain Koide BX008) TaxID=946122 RepID=A0A0C2WJS5_AMAMK|nr:hypothetical protein M378DRAFT_13277 [Amanita muscaria Koide BX008]
MSGWEEMLENALNSPQLSLIAPLPVETAFLDDVGRTVHGRAVPEPEPSRSTDVRHTARVETLLEPSLYRHGTAGPVHGTGGSPTIASITKPYKG